jgi:hypothetical protein
MSAATGAAVAAPRLCSNPSLALRLVLLYLHSATKWLAAQFHLMVAKQNSLSPTTIARTTITTTTIHTQTRTRNLSKQVPGARPTSRCQHLVNKRLKIHLATAIRRPTRSSLRRENTPTRSIAAHLLHSKPGAHT